MKLDIIQMNYLIAIVEADYNLSIAAKQIHVTQSTLSQFITNFEKNENITLFHRKNGRLISLTPIGRKLYAEVQEILDKYNELELMVKKESNIQKGKVKIGMPSMILRVLFTKFFPDFMINHPNLNIEIIEDDSKQLRDMLMDSELDIAIIEEPTLLDTDLFEQHILMLSEIAGFMNPLHELAAKDSLSWQDLDEYNITMLSHEFGSNKLLMNKLEKINSKSNLLMTSSSWDYLVETTAINNLVSLLPTVNFNRYIERLNYIGVIEKRFSDPIPFIPMLCRAKRSKYNNAEAYIFETLLNNFYQLTETD